MVSRGTAVLYLHLQGDVISPEGAYGDAFAAEVSRRAVVENCNLLSAAVRDAQALNVFLRLAFAPDQSDLLANMPMLERTASLRAFIDGTPGASFAPGVVVCESDQVLAHTRPGPFTSSGLDTLLREHGVERVGIAGVATNASVESAVRQAADLGYYVSVVADACAAADPATHEASLSSLALFAQITDVRSFSALLV